jgi:hypothetical protein
MLLYIVHQAEAYCTVYHLQYCNDLLTDVKSPYQECVDRDMYFRLDSALPSYQVMCMNTT